MEFLVKTVAVTIGIVIAWWILGRRNAKLAPRIQASLAERGPQTLHELASALGMGGFYARGKVVLALNEMIQRREVVVLEAPPGTPQLQKVHHIRYTLATTGQGS